MKPTPDRINIPEFVPVFDRIPGLNAQRLDYKLLSNRP